MTGIEIKVIACTNVDDWIDGMPVAAAIERLQHLVQEYVPEEYRDTAFLEVDYFESRDLTLAFKRPESEEERAYRLNEESRREAYERQAYERLKAKFEPKESSKE